ncbi:MAG: hypothetical protein V1809_01025 [Planctomycetota bacterium]
MGIVFLLLGMGIIISAVFQWRRGQIRYHRPARGARILGERKSMNAEDDIWRFRALLIVKILGGILLVIVALAILFDG